jgi:hypothetical protein
LHPAGAQLAKLPHRATERQPKHRLLPRTLSSQARPEAPVSNRRAGFQPAPRTLPYFNFEKRVIGVLMAPLEVFGLLGAFHFWEFNILAMLLSQIEPVGFIFLAVPGVIVATVAIVIPLIVMVISPRRYRDEPGCAE